MIKPVEHPRLSSKTASVQDRHGTLDSGSGELEQNTFEWNLIRCKNPNRFHLIAVGEAMRTIRDRELFRIEYETWADFCREELKISVNQAERRMQCADIASELVRADCVHVPFNENQCRPLIKLEAGFLRVYAWELACSLKPVGKAPTGNDVVRAVSLLESWRPPINEEKRPYFDVRRLLYESRIPIKLAQQISSSSSFQEWANEQETNIERRLLRNLVTDLVARLKSLEV
ncbi:MAG: hypothetical protein JO170_13585 [Verrucomicrobia bacterium]|nr:hypothetical protein [Verrucomicrobiota bacterium]